MTEINPDLPSGIEMDRQIAELLGWTDIEQREIFYENFDGSGFAPALVGTRDGISTYEIPGWSVSERDALALPYPDCVSLMIERVSENDRERRGYTYYVKVWFSVLRERWWVREIWTKGDFLALTLCKAWLQWQQLQQKSR
jgi:hypothetical protein